MRAAALPVLAALAALAGGRDAWAQDTPAAVEREREPARTLLGAASPRPGTLVLAGNVGMAFVLPQVAALARLGTGGGTSAELRYKNLAAFGHEGRARFAWGTPVTGAIDLGLAARTSITSLAMADGGLIGIQFSNLALGNDWDVGHDLLVSYNRDKRASVTASIGASWTIGGTRYSSFEESSFELEPGFRSIDAAIQGEWPLHREKSGASRLNVVLRLDAMFLVGTDIVPLGFLPTGSLGLAWRV